MSGLSACTPIVAKYDPPGPSAANTAAACDARSWRTYSTSWLKAASKSDQPSGTVVGHFERQWTGTGEAAGVLDRTRRRVVAESTAYVSVVDEQAQEAAAVAADVQDFSPRQRRVDHLEHGEPDESVLVLHDLVLEQLHASTGRSCGSHYWCRVRPRSGCDSRTEPVP